MRRRVWSRTSRLSLTSHTAHIAALPLQTIAMATQTPLHGAAQLLSKCSRPASAVCRASRRHFSNSPATFAFSSVPKAQAATSTSTTTAKSAPSPSTAQRTVTPSFPAKEPPVPTSRNTAAADAAAGQRSLTDGLSDAPPEVEGVPAIDWTRSYHGLGSVTFTPEQSEILLGPLAQDDIEVKPDGIIYLPEIKYRRILNKAFGPGGWGLAPRGESIVTGKIVTREYGLIVQGRYASPPRQVY